MFLQEAQRLAKAQKQAEAGVKHKTGTEGMYTVVFVVFISWNYLKCMSTNTG